MIGCSFSVLFLIGQLAVMVAASKEQCSNKGSVYVNGRCFTLYEEKVTKEEAQTGCETQTGGGTLAELRTKEEVQIVMALLTSDTIEPWVAATDSQTELEFRWPSDNSIADSGDDWLKLPGRDDKNSDCTSIRKHEDHCHLDQQKCTSEMNGFLCQEEIWNRCTYLLPSAEFYDDSCFLVVETKMTSHQAQGHCENMGAIVAEPKTEKINNFVTDLANKYSAKSGSTAYRIGGTQSGNNSWTWVRSNEAFSYKNWATSELTDKKTVVMLKSAGWKWVASADTPLQPFICQRDIGNPCEGQFPGAVYDRGQCFRYFDTPSTFEEAKAICKEHDAFAVEPKTKEINTALIRYLRSLKNADTKVFIGGQRIGTTVNFKWVTSQNPFTYKGWQKDQPDNRSGNDIYVIVDLVTPTGWDDVPEDSRYPFVCQKEQKVLAKESYVVIFPSPEVDFGSAVIHVTSGFRTFPVYIELRDSTKTYLTTAVSYTDSFRYEMGSDLRVTSTGLHGGGVIIETYDFVTVVLVLKHDKSLATSLIPRRGWVQDRVTKGKMYFLPSPSHGVVSGNLLTVTTMRYYQDSARFYIPKQDSGSELFLNGTKYSTGVCTTITANMSFSLDPVLVTDYCGLNGVFLETDFTSLVMVGRFRTEEADTVTSDATIGQVLPIDLADTEYITFPSKYTGSSGMDTFRIIAIYENTTIKISDEAITISLASAGEVMDVNLTASKFHHVSSDKRFYIVQFSGAQQEPHACVTSLFPKSLWRYQYDFVVTSEYNSYDVLIMCVLDVNMTPFLQLNDQSVSPKCQTIAGTSYAGCTIETPPGSSEYHIYLTDYPVRFGAYLYAFNDKSASCHPLGYESPLSIGEEFDVASYLNDFWSNSCLDLTTQADTTTPTLTTTPPPENTSEFALTTSSDAPTATSSTTTTPPPEDTTELAFTPTSDAPTTTSSTTTTTTPPPEDTTELAFTPTSDAPTTTSSTTTTTTAPPPKDTTELTFTTSSDAPTATSTTTTTTTTTTEPPQAATPNCSCIFHHHYTFEPVENLLIDPRSTSAFKRTKISVHDHRISPVVIGVSGILLMMGAVLFVVFLDLHRIFTSDDSATK